MQVALPTPDNPSICATPFQFARGAFNLKGVPLNLKSRPWLPAVYNLEVTKYPGDRQWRKSVLQFGRQSEKSSSIGYKLLSLSAMLPSLRCLYVNPSTIQIREFSDERLKTPLSESRFFDQFFIDRFGRRIPQNVSTKWFANNSKISLRASFLNADRIRGLAVDYLTIDEFQDILTDNLPVIEETLFHCELNDGPISTYAGTPLGFDTPLEYYWSRLSTQAEWLTKCERCGKWNRIEQKSIGEDGLECTKCRGPYDPVRGKSQWVMFGNEDSPYMGFRLPQPAVIYSFRDKPTVFGLKWQELREKFNKYSPARLANEVFAQPYDGGIKPVTRDQLMDCCDPAHLGPYADNIIQQIKTTNHTWAGIDWGSGTSSNTVLTVLRYRGHRIEVAYFKKYEGLEAEPEFVIKHIADILRRMNVSRIGADYGFGFGMNSQLRSVFPSKLMEYQYVGSQKSTVKFDGSKFTAHRTPVMTWLFEVIRKKQIIFPNWDIFQRELLSDILCISSSKSPGNRSLVYNHPPGTKDDFFHSMIFAFLASMWDVERPDLVAPDTVGRHWTVKGN